MGDEHSLQLEFSELEHFPNCAQNKTNVVYAKVSSPDDRWIVITSYSTNTNTNGF